jgi:CP family cyanate transporter-like MFS transporter
MTSLPTKNRRTALWTLAGLILLTVNLRAAITSVSPLLDDLQQRFGLPSAAMGVLTTLPVLCLGAFAALAPPLARRLGPEATLTGALVLIASGILLRLTPEPVALFTGTAMAGAGIAIGNVLAPYVIKRTFPRHVGALTGMTMLLMSGGAALPAGLAVPLSDAGGWRLGLGVWAVPAVLAAAVWAPLAVRRRDGGEHPRNTEDTPSRGGGSLLRDRVAWQVTGFLGMQSLAFYVLTSWLPAIMRDHGYAPATAGLMLSIVMLFGIPAGLVVPMVAARMRDQRPLVVVVMAAMALGVTLLLTPVGGWFCVVALGVGTGSAFPLAFTLISLRSPNPAAAARLSGMAQAIGYLVAGLGPFGFGVLNDLTGGWTIPLAVLLVWLLPEALVAWRAARPAFVLQGSSGRDLVVEPKHLPAVATARR